MTTGPQAVILVGGLGTRLGALTAMVPKPLIPINGRPFLEILVDALARHGIRRLVLMAGHLGDQLSAFAARIGAGGIDVACVVEPEPAGTGGALHYARDRLDPRFLLLNGDSFFDIDYSDLIGRPAAVPDALGRVALRQVEDAARYGLVVCDQGRITVFAERPPGPGPGVINGGIYWLDRRVLDHIGPPPCSLERDVLPGLAAAGCLEGAVYDRFFIDIGIPEDLERARHSLPGRTTA